MPEISAEDALKICGVEYLQVNNEWLHVRCPFHLDDHIDLASVKGRVNPDNGAYKCLAGSCGFVTNVHAVIAATLTKTLGTSKSVADVKKLLSLTTTGKQALSDGVVDAYHHNLCKNAEIQQKLRGKGITYDDITTYRLGFNGSSGRVTIPVHADGSLVNIRHYLFGAPKGKKYLNEKGHGSVRLYLKEKIETASDVYVTEGEFKAIILNRMGFTAVSPTGGCDNWDADWNTLFSGRDVILVLDADTAGRRGAGKLSAILHRYANSVRNVFLSETLALGPGKNDIIDYFVTLKKTADDFRQLCIGTVPYAPPEAPKSDLDSEEVFETHLSETSHAKYSRRRVKTNVVVSAKATQPFTIPEKVQVVCDADQSYCDLCHVSTNRGFKFSVKRDDPVILEMIGVSTKVQHEALKACSGVYQKCSKSKMHVESSMNIEELRLIPQIEVGHNTSEMVVRKAYAIEHGVETNTSYEVVARSCVEPGTQAATLVIYESKKSQDDISLFKLRHDMTLFQPSEWTVEAVEAKLNDIYEDLEHNVTKIYNRKDLHFFVDLVYHSTLYVPFQGDLRKGWVDALCIGDSGQGKTECSSRMLKHYGAGERVDTKSSSVAGLVGGCEETNGRWFIKWGTIPLNDRRLVVLEEVKGAPAENLAKLTDMRSSGTAEIVKIERAKTHARTRLIWISNPRSDRKLCTYNYGVDAVRELIGSLEDIRRFDMVIAVASGDVANTVINMVVSDRDIVPHAYTDELCHHLVMWAWSRNEKQIILDEDAERELLQAATRMGNKYSSSCPIVEPSDQRLKLLRLATACAARTFSTEDDETLIIRACHVRVVERFLERIYNSKALGYAEYSGSQKAESTILDPEAIELFITTKLPNAAESIRALIDTDAITFQTMVDITEWMKEDANAFIGMLVRKQALRPLRRGGYRKTPAFTELLKTLDRRNLGNKTQTQIMQELGNEL